ncbi:MAG: hypothetical protein ABSB58_02465 [Gemmatimonadales bacterium]|jgi:hypothetical protein
MKSRTSFFLLLIGLLLSGCSAALQHPGSLLAPGRRIRVESPFLPEDSRVGTLVALTGDSIAF